MPTKTKLTLEGLEDYLEMLVELDKDVDSAAGEALVAGADVLVDDMKRRASWSRRIPPYIRRTPLMRDGNRVYVYVGLLHGTPQDIARMGATYEYGGKQSGEIVAVRVRKTVGGEKGTVRRISRPWIKARPFIRPGLNQYRKAKDAMAKVFEEWLEK